MLLQEEIRVVLNNKYIKHFENLGYEIPRTKNSSRNWTVKRGTTIKVKIKDLPPSSDLKIPVLCDYCFEEGKLTICWKQVKEYNKTLKRNFVKDCCEEHKYIKIIESNMNNYNVRSTQQIPEIREKFINSMVENHGVMYSGQSPELLQKTRDTMEERYGVDSYAKTDEFKERYKNTCQDKYGVNHIWQLEETRDKIKQTTLERYGEEHYSKTDEYKEKVRQTSLDRYGVESYTQTDECKERIKQTCLDKYGVDNYSKTEEFKIKYVQSIYNNNSITSSKQQRYVCKLLNGQLNYPLQENNNICFMDIAFPNDKIYIETDFSGHWLSVTFGIKTMEEFEKNERRRTYFLLNRNWKEIRIISRKDKLPSDVMIFKIINDSKLLFDEGFHRVVFDIDNSTYETSKFKKDYDFGKLYNTRNLVVD